MYLLDAADATVPAFKESGRDRRFDRGGGGEGLWNCHIHTNDVGAAIEAALDAGRPRNIRVTDLDEQIEEERWVRDCRRLGTGRGGRHRPTAPDGGGGCGQRRGVGRIFRSLGVHHLVAGGQSMNPSTAQILEVSRPWPRPTSSSCPTTTTSVGGHAGVRAVDQDGAGGPTSGIVEASPRCSSTTGGRRRRQRRRHG